MISKTCDCLDIDPLIQWLPAIAQTLVALQRHSPIKFVNSRDIWSFSEKAIPMSEINHCV